MIKDPGKEVALALGDEGRLLGKVLDSVLLTSPESLVSCIINYA